MSKPVLGPCGGQGQPACPPQPAAQVNIGDVVEIDGQKYELQDEDDQGEDEQE